jgi:hypothetical protein
MLSRRGFLTGIAASGLARSQILSISAEPPIRLCRFGLMFLKELAIAASTSSVMRVDSHSQHCALYTPESASAAELLTMHRALHISRVLIVQPSDHGMDYSCTLDAMKQYGSLMSKREGMFHS